MIENSTKRKVRQNKDLREQIKLRTAQEHLNIFT